VIGRRINACNIVAPQVVFCGAVDAKMGEI